MLSRVKIDFEAKRITDKGLIDGYATYEATFAIPDSRTDLYTGLPINKSVRFCLRSCAPPLELTHAADSNEQGKEGANPAHEGAFDALYALTRPHRTPTPAPMHSALSSACLCGSWAVTVRGCDGAGCTR
eukprot:1425562-Rhodomonas_salina.1